MRLAALLPTAWLWLAGPLAAQDFFPLDVGNQWIYRSGNNVMAAQVVRTDSFNSRNYYLLEGFFGGNAWLRRSGDGSLVSYDSASNAERLWTPFGLDEGGAFTSGIPPCQQPAQLVSKSASYTGPIGSFNYALQIDYQAGSCADAGIQRDLYLPYVGLVQRRETTIAGPRTWDLVYARMGVSEISAPETGFHLTLDNSVYTVPATLIARLTVRHTQAAPLLLTFPTGQRYDLAILNSAGAEVYRWSSGLAFPQMVGTETVSGERNWVVSVPLPDPLLPGNYIAQAWLSTSGPRTWMGSAGFEVEAGKR